MSKFTKLSHKQHTSNVRNRFLQGQQFLPVNIKFYRHFFFLNPIKIREQ